MPYCEVCKKNNITPWLTYNNTFKNKNCHICSYICYANCNHKFPWDNIVNKKDFMKYPIPFVNFKKYEDSSDDFKILSEYEIKNLSISSKTDYYNKLESIMNTTNKDTINDVIEWVNNEYYDNMCYSTDEET
jgi:hypothetical protein